MTANRLPDVYLSITDYGLGILPGGSAGIIAKVGVSSKGKENTIALLSDSDQIVPNFGSGVLVDSLADSFTGGSKTIYAVRAAADIPGTISEVVKTAAEGDTSTLKVESASKPLDAYDVIVEITGSGALNAAYFRYSLDGGSSYSDRITVPSTGKYTLADTGLEMTFTGDFIAGTVWKFKTTAPQASVGNIIAAVQVLLDSALTYECIHVCGESDPAVWTALDVLAKQAEADYRYCYIEADAPYKSGNQTTDEWVQYLSNARANFASTRVGVCAAFGTVVDMLTGKQVVRNLHGIIRGQISTLKRQESPGAVEKGGLNGVVNIQPADLNNAQILALDNAGFTTVRKFIGLNGIYITNGRMMSENGSDYEQEENRRVMDHSCELVRSQALKKVKSGIPAEGPKALEAFLSHALNSQIGEGEIISGTVVIPDDQDVWSTSKITTKIRIVPVPIMREIEIDIGFENPYLTTETEG